MVGSGTVAVEAVAYGKSGLYSDVDPLSCLLTRAKSRAVDPEWLLDSIKAIIEKAQPLARPGIEQREARKYIADLEGSTLFRAPPDVFHWFLPYVVINLCKTLANVAEMDGSSRRRDALLATFAGTIRRLSRADPNTSSGLEVTKIMRKALQSGLRFDLASELTRKADQLARGYRALRKTVGIGEVKVAQHDARNWSALCAKHSTWPDLVVTSPCYISAIEYWRRHKLEYSWLGLVPPEKLSEVKHRFLGMGLEDPNTDQLPSYIQNLEMKLRKLDRVADAKVLARYFNDSVSWLTEISTVLRRSAGRAYIIVGGNTKHGVHLNTPLALREIAKEVGLSTSVFMKYKIKNSYMQYPTNGTRIKVETVLKIAPES